MPGLCQGLALQGAGVPERTHPCNPGVFDQVESAALSLPWVGNRREAGNQMGLSSFDAPTGELG